MSNKENIVWLDGYFKGITALNNGQGGFTFNALLIELTGTDFVKSYMDFININDEADLLGVEFSPLKLSECKPVNDWLEIVTNNIGRAFSGIKTELFQSVISQVLDILDMVVPESCASKNFLCSAKMGSSSGEYLFFQLSGHQYVVLSFLYH